MRAIWTYALLSVAWTTLHGSVVAGERDALLPRQDISPKAGSTSTIQANAKAAKSTPEPLDPTRTSSTDDGVSSQNADGPKKESPLDIIATATTSRRAALSGTAALGTAGATGKPLSNKASNGNTSILDKKSFCILK